MFIDLVADVNSFSMQKRKTNTGPKPGIKHKTYITERARAYHLLRFRFFC